jgi:hypothetical protein
MNRAKMMIAIVVCPLMLLAGGIGIMFLHAPDRPAAQVDRILKQDMLPGKNFQKGLDELWALGPGIIPHLAAEARLPDSFVSQHYPDLWRKIPPRIRHYLPPPVDRSELRGAALHAISEFGPLAVRGAAPAVIAGLSGTNYGNDGNYYAVLGVRWLLPDSLLAQAAWKRGLAGSFTNSPTPDTFDNLGDNNTVLPKVPGVFPLLTNFLGNAGAAYLGAISLGGLGANAAPAIPALIQTADLGAAGPFTNVEAARRHVGMGFSNPLGWHQVTFIQDDKGMNHNRAMAVLALGRIGVATPEVCAALVRAWNAPDPWVRANAAQAVVLIGPAMTSNLPGLLSGLMDTDNSALDHKLLAIGKLGPGAQSALETLRELTNTNRLRSLVADPEANVVASSLEDLAVAAKVAICRINPGEGRPFLPEFANQINRSWEPVAFLIEHGPLSNDVVRAVEPLLDEGETMRQSMAAFVILHHDRQHLKALEVLRRNKAGGKLEDRLFAGAWLFETIGETNGLCPIISEAFQRPESFMGQNAANLADEMGDAARPALPAIRAALWHKDVFVRQRAGILMLKLAPEEIPINEGK